MTDEACITLCQAEMRRLRAVIRDYTKTAQTINYQYLFDLWADFDDAEAPDAVLRIIETADLAPVDALSFIAFCYGYEQATKNKGETNER